MLDFNTKKRILKRLSDCAEKHFLMLIPCLLAAAFVKLFYFIVCSVDIALSDKDGNFLGIRRASRGKTRRRRQDDIVFVKRSFGSRLVSGVLAASFAGMLVPTAMPAITALAATGASDYKLYTGYGSDANLYDYYYDASPSNIFMNPWEINDGGCIVGYDSVQLSLTQYDARSASVDSKTHGAIYSAGIYYDVYSKGGSVAESTGNVVANKTINDSSYTTTSLYNWVSQQVTGLNASKEYHFYTIIKQTIILYGIPVGDGISNYVDSDGNITSYTDPTSGTTTKVKTVYYRHEIRSDDEYVVQMGSLLTSPSFSVAYDSTNNDIDITINSDTDNSGHEIAGYLIYRSEESISGTTKTMGDYKYLGYVTKSSFSSTGIIYSDSDIDYTKKYSYVVCTYSDIYSNGDAYSTSKSSLYMTSQLPSGTNDYGCAVSVYTPTKQPYPVTITDNNTYFTLSWTAVTGATAYYISRECTSAGHSCNDMEVEIQADGSTTYTYDDKTAAYSSTDPHIYTYTIWAVNSDNTGTDGSGSAKSSETVLTGYQLNPEISRPYNISIKAGDTDATLYWYCNDSDVTGFDIIMEKVIYDDSGNETGTETTTITVTASQALISTDSSGKSYYSYTEYDMTAGATYRFQIRSYMIIASSGEKEPVSEYYPNPCIEVSISTDFEAPQEIEATPSDSQIVVSWSASENADKYILYIYKLEDGEYVEVGTRTVSRTTYTHKNLENGDTYKYYVVAQKTVNGQTILSDPSYEVAATVGDPLKKPTDLTATFDGDDVTITWTAVSGAEGYLLYIVGSDGTADIKDITKNSYTQTDAVYGVTYRYYVYAYKTIQLSSGTYQYYKSERSDIESLTIGGSVSTPSGLVAASSDGQIDLTWTAVTDADGYIVYATNSSGTTTTYNVSTNSFSHTGLTAGDVYTYYVVAYEYVNGTAVYSSASASVTATVGGSISAPTDFAVTTTDSSAVLTWTAVSGAAGYTVYGYSSDGATLEVDVSKTTYTHSGLTSGDTWTYYVRAYKTVNSQRVYSSTTNYVSVTIGSVLPAPTDLVATSGNRQVALKWTTVKGASGYIVYLYDDSTSTFQPLTIVSKGTYTHTGLKNGTKYTYMVAAYVVENGTRVIGDYSLAVSAIPTSGNSADVDYTINIKGTAPYGISHSELISAAANHDAFDDPVDAYISVNDESTRAIKEVLRGYANGLSSFIIYPFDISLYLEDTLVAVEPNDGYNVTFTIPVPDQMIEYRDYITVVHLKTDGTETIYEDSDDDIYISSSELEVLASTIIDVNGVWCVQFITDSCSPFAFVIYRDNLDDVSSGNASSASSSSTGNFDTGVLLYTSLPDIIPVEKKTKFVVAVKKRYKVKEWQSTNNG